MGVNTPTLHLLNSSTLLGLFGGLRLFLAYVLAGISRHHSLVTAASLISYAISIPTIYPCNTRKTRLTGENFRGHLVWQLSYGLDCDRPCGRVLFAGARIRVIMFVPKIPDLMMKNEPRKFFGLE
jgi:hypothetical protein